MAWGKKEKFTPAVLFIYPRVRVVGVEVLHYPDRFCSKTAMWRHGVGRRLLKPCYDAMMARSNCAVNRHIV
jgi:hypothetical protein